jgi:hypothetical protein
MKRSKEDSIEDIRSYRNFPIFKIDIKKLMTGVYMNISG